MLKRNRWTAEQWNERHPVGTRVRFRDSTNDLRTVTRSAAWTLGGGTAVVAIEGKSGGVGLDFLTLELEERG